MSQYEQMTKAQLLDEVQGLRERVGILEGLASEREQVEEALRESEEEYRILVENSPDLVLLQAPDGEVLHCSSRSTEILGYSPEEVRTLDVFESIDKADVERVREAYTEALRGEELVDVQYRFIDPTGKPVWLSHTARPVRVGGGLKAIQSNIRDITELRRAEEALRESEKRFRELAELLPVVVFETDEDNRLTYMNRKAYEVFAYSPDDFDAGLDGFCMIVESEREHARDRFARRLRGEPLDIHEYTGLRNDGGTFPTLLDIVPILRGDRVVGSRGIIVDITERNRAEEKLRQSDERLRKAQRTAKIGNWEYDIPTGKVWGSEEAFRIYGIERTSEFLPLDEVEDHILEAERVNQALVDLITRNAPYDLEFEIRPGNRDGVTQIHSIAELDCDPSGDPVRVRGVIQDITERKQAEAALRESEERFRTMFEKHDGIMLLIEPDSGAILDANAAAQKFYGYSLETFRRMAIQDINTLPPEEVAELRKSAEEEERNCFEFPHRLSNGDVRTVEVHSSPLITSGQIILFSIIHDITERKRAEEELTKYRSFLEKAQELGHIGTWELDLQKDELFWTEESYRIFGVPQGTPATYETFLERVHPDDRELIDREWKAAVGGAPYKVEHRILVDGEVKWVTQEAELTLDQDGTPIRGIGFIQDITERRQAEEAHSKLEAQLTQAQKLESVGRLAGGVAHDFNNMLSVILGYTDMALSGMDPSDPLYHAFTEIEQAGSRSADLTRQLLTFARKQVVAPKVLDLNEVSQSMLTMLRRLIGEDIDLVWMPGRDTWPVSVDPAQVDQMLANLCVNARDAISGVGKVTIETENVTLDEDSVAAQSELRSGDFVMLAVSDDGCGMDADTKEHIFEPFYTTKAVGEGTGLGLATVYGIAKQNGGFVTVYSEVGEGTTFKIYLPRHVGDAAEATQSEPTAMPRGQGETVLLVEDEAAVLKVGSAMLSRLGYTVLTAGSPGEALTLMTSHSGEIDLLIADVVMPEMNGRELAEQLQSQSPGLRCLFVSGYTADVILHRGVLNEGVQFLQKPFTASRLAVAVKEALRGG